METGEIKRKAHEVLSLLEGWNRRDIEFMIAIIRSTVDQVSIIPAGALSNPISKDEITGCVIDAEQS